jgi:hypothetical protein
MAWVCASQRNKSVSWVSKVGSERKFQWLGMIQKAKICRGTFLLCGEEEAVEGGVVGPGAAEGEASGGAFQDVVVVIFGGDAAVGGHEEGGGGG